MVIWRARPSGGFFKYFIDAQLAQWRKQPSSGAQRSSINVSTGVFPTPYRGRQSRDNDLSNGARVLVFLRPRPLGTISAGGVTPTGSVTFRTEQHHYAFFNCNLCRNREKFCVATIHLLEHPAHGRDAQQHQSGALSNVKTRQLIRPVVQYAGDRPCVGRTGNNAISLTMSSLLLIKPVQGFLPFFTITENDLS
ncbi:hypothetical protein T01_10947 [Trichinella spiralis]|uniref:Uncharacterized protein n=1 Tax=Trichinella spiralis TaxID=6334 RepID=A0A0V1B082_TRISP|nr:hypothetical protein T01_4902 [Trichinella spiralis]KRY26650.1 hypothetical protein T01_6674 [Trichinella spiralis]KRY30369.1 hypothetical protein T01_10947 [Trichinella spiralis]